MNSSDILKLRDKQTRELADVAQQTGKLAMTSASQAELFVNISHNFWLSEIAYQLALKNENKHPFQELSLWERTFGRKA